MIRSICFAKNHPAIRNASAEEIATYLKDKDTLVWVSLENADDQEISMVLKDWFHFHPLPIEDVMSSGYQTAKIDDFLTYIFIIAHAINPDFSLVNLDTMELDLFLGENFLVTCSHQQNMPPVEKVWKMIERDERLYQNGSDFLCHAILDALVDDYMPLIDQLDEEIDWLEDQVLSTPEPKTLERILNLKHAVMSLRRIISPQREVINRLSRDEFPMIDRQSRIYYRDIYDHLVRIQDLTESLRDIVSGAMDIYLSSTSLKLNNVMKALTIVSTIFLPMSFITGIFGMNFKYLPGLESQTAVSIMWAVFIIVPVGMLSFFKYKKWF
jgi:magnesium transporter